MGMAILHPLRHAQRRRGVEPFVGENHALGPAFSDQPGQSLGAAAARQQSDRCLRQGHLRVFFRDPQIAGECALESAAHRVAIDRRNDDRTRLLQGLECGAEALCHEPGPHFVAVREALDVGPGAEEFIAVTAEDGGIHALVSIQIADQRLKLAQSLGGERVGGRVVDDDERDMRVHLAFDHDLLRRGFTTAA